ncbi:MAG: DUF790 family protein, partial [Candidatus Heimdallarchaeaceae archaeon]
MRIALSQFEFEIRGSRNKTELKPFFLSYSDEKKVEAVIQFLEDSIGKKKKEIDFSALDNIFLSEKIARALVTSASRFYLFQSQYLKSFVNDDEGTIQEKKKEQFTDIQSFLNAKQKKEQKNTLPLTPSQLRERVFDLINQHYPQGFVSHDKRKEALERIEKELKIPQNKLEDMLYCDIESEKILTKKEEVEVDSHKLIQFYNYDVIETALSHSQTIILKLSDLPGFLAKKIVYVSKANYVWTEIQSDDPSDSYIVTIEPPLEVFQDSTTWGKNLANVALFILRMAIKEKYKLSIQAIVQPRKRKAVFLLDTQLAPPLPTFRVEESEETEKEAEIDSNVEKVFMSAWKKDMQGWKAEAEPETIFLGKKLFVPDFILTRGTKKIYLEIVGYYTTKYIQKKKKKMLEMKKVGLPIIYLVDEQLQSYFVDMLEI